MASTTPVRANTLRQLLSRPCSANRRSLLPAISPLPTTPPRQLHHRCQHPATRLFSSSPVSLKKGAKQAKEQARAAAAPETDSGEDDPSDFSSLNSGISKALDKLGSDLAKLRTGGRFNPEALESLRVHVSKDSKASIRLGELAQVVPKGGRSIMILVGEREHVKPVVSAIQASPELNLQPQPDAHNANQLNVPVPPPTKESRERALQDAGRAGDVASTGIRGARAAMQKRLRAMELKKAARPDDLKKAGKEMEKIVERGVAEVKKTVDAARKTMESA